MKISKAIVILQILCAETGKEMLPDLEAAVKLGTEALKAWKKLREGRAGVYNSTLPGETKD